MQLLRMKRLQRSSLQHNSLQLDQAGVQPQLQVRLLQPHRLLRQ